MPEKFSKTSSPSPAPCRLALQLLALSLVFGTAALIAVPSLAQDPSLGKPRRYPTEGGGYKNVYTDGEGRIIRTDYFDKDFDYAGHKFEAGKILRTEETSFHPNGTEETKRTIDYDWAKDKRTSKTIVKDKDGNKTKSLEYYFYPVGAEEPYAKYDPKTGWEFRDSKSGDWVALPDSKVGEKKPSRYTPGKGWELYDPKTKEWLPTSEFGKEEPEAVYTPGKGWTVWNQKKGERVPIAKSAFDALNPKPGAGGSTATTTSAGTPQLKSVAKVGDGLGRVWKVTEGSWQGTWTRRPDSNTFDAHWEIPGTGYSGDDVIDLVSVDGGNVRLYRHGQKGYYTGTLSPDRRGVINGTADWYQSGWPPWTATFE